MKILKLINLPDLILLAFAMFVFRYGFLTQQEIMPALGDLQYAILVVSCVFIAAGGFLMNNVAGIGRTTPTGLSEAQSYNLYIILTLIGVGLGYYIANYVGKPMHTGVFLIAAATLYIYTTSLKQTLLVSNIIIAIIMALPIVTIGLFNFYPILTPYNQTLLATLFDLLLDYAIFIFVISLAYTFLNDIDNADSDYNSGISTLPIVLGRARTIKAVCVFMVLPMAMLLYYGNKYMMDLIWALGYGIFFILGLIIYFVIKLWNSKTQKDFKQLKVVLKLVLFFTAISIAVITFNIKHNAQG